MRGDDNQQEGMFSCISSEKRVSVEHPLRPIRKTVDEIPRECRRSLPSVFKCGSTVDCKGTAHCCCRSSIRYAASAC